MTLVRGLRQAADRLAKLDIGDAVTNGLQTAAGQLEAKVAESLLRTPGQDHSAPWLRTGALRASISHQIVGNTAVIGSSSDVAVDQEIGTRSIPPRPFMATTAAAEAENIVRLLADSLVQKIADL